MDIEFYKNQKGPRTATMMGSDKQFIFRPNQKKIKVDSTCLSSIKCKSRWFSKLQQWHDIITFTFQRRKWF